MNDMKTVLTAIASVESMSGRNNYPRLERSYMPTGQVVTVQGRLIEGTGGNFTQVARSRWEKYGMATACSFGPWQILYHTAADRGFNGHPADLWDGSEEWVRREIMRQFNKGATTIGKLADAWNSGNFLDANVPGLYIAKVVEAFTRAGGDPTLPLQL